MGNWDFLVRTIVMIIALPIGMLANYFTVMWIIDNYQKTKKQKCKCNCGKCSCCRKKSEEQKPPLKKIPDNEVDEIL